MSYVTSFRLTREQRDKLEELARQMETSRNGVIVRWIDEAEVQKNTSAKLSQGVRAGVETSN